MSYVDPRKVLEDVYDEEFGLRLTNFSIKPVHVANGLARALTRRTYDTAPLAHTLRRYVRKQKLGVDEERNPNPRILASYGEAFEALRGTEPDEQNLNRLRALTLEVLGADGAVFDQADKSSFTLSNERFVTRDPSDDRAGLFLARLLTGPPEGRADAAECLRNLLKSEDDAWTTLALPLLELGGEGQEESDSGEAATRAAKADHLFSEADDGFSSPTLAALRDAYDRLARFERLEGSKLNSLRRLVLYGCFAIHVHVISRWSEREPGAPQPPILLDLFDGTVVSVRDASRATLRAASDVIEGLVISRFAEHVEAEYGADEASILAALGAEPQAAHLHSSLSAHFAEGGGGEAVRVLAEQLAYEAFSAVRGGEDPIGALIELGRRAGFLTPWANAGRGGKLKKRYTATAEFLETLIIATVEPDEPLEFPEFLERLRDQFGIVVGRPEDDELIRHNNLNGTQFGPPTAMNEEDLRRNVEELRHLVVESGYGKSYADGRTIVTTRPEGRL